MSVEVKVLQNSGLLYHLFERYRKSRRQHNRLALFAAQGASKGAVRPRAVRVFTRFKQRSAGLGPGRARRVAAQAGGYSVFSKPVGARRDV